MQNLKILLEAKRQRELLENAEQKGKNAFDNGSSIEENPFEINSKEFICWRSGWLISSIKNESVELHSFIRWVCNVCFHLEELLLNNADQNEILTKLKNIPEKSIELLPELAELIDKEE